jgi:hypothetical protein
MRLLFMFMSICPSRLRLQRLILRVVALVSLAAVPAILMPRLAAQKLSWLMGFDQAPITPLLLYMMAGGSCVFVGQAVMLWVLSGDVVRYQPLVRVVAWIYLVCAPLFLWIDSQAGLPAWWVAMDSLGCFIAGAALAWTFRKEKASS